MNPVEEECAPIRAEDLASLFVPQVALSVATPAMFAAPLAPAEERAVAGSVASRRRHYAAGRACARQALAAVGQTDYPLVRGAGGAPIWPVGIVGSLSHTAGCCIAAVARTEHVAAIGIDVESAVPLPREVVPLICSTAEARALDRTATQQALGPTVIFSAKEAIYKAYFPRYRRFLDFGEVELAGAYATSDRGVLTATLAGRSPSEQDFIARLRIQWLVKNGYVFTGALLTTQDEVSTPSSLR